MSENLILVAEIGAAHGVTGEFKLISHTADPADILDYGPLLNADGKTAVTIVSARAHKGALVVRAEEIKDRTEAEKRRGQKLFVPRDAFAALDDPDDYYITDLIGLTVRDKQGEPLGVIKSVDNFGAGDLLDIALTSGKRVYVDFTHDNVGDVNITEGFIVLEDTANLL